MSNNIFDGIEDNKTYDLELGDTWHTDKSYHYHTIKYDFKPASVVRSEQAELSVGNAQDVSITIPNIEGSTTQGSHFSGNTKSYTTKECLMIIDPKTGKVTLEKLSANVRVKNVRMENNRSTIKPSKIVASNNTTASTSTVKNENSINNKQTQPSSLNTITDSSTKKQITTGTTNDELKKVEKTTTPKQFTPSTSSLNTTKTATPVPSQQQQQSNRKSMPPAANKSAPIKPMPNNSSSNNNNNNNAQHRSSSDRLSESSTPPSAPPTSHSAFGRRHSNIDNKTLEEDLRLSDTSDDEIDI